MAISKSKQAAINSRIKITQRKLKSAKHDASRKWVGADVRVKTHEASLVRLVASKGKPAAVAAR